MWERVYGVFYSDGPARLAGGGTPRLFTDHSSGHLLEGGGYLARGGQSHACLHCMHSMDRMAVAQLHTNTRPHSHSLLRRLCLRVAPKKLIIAKGGA